MHGFMNVKITNRKKEYILIFSKQKAETDDL
jgi:hypothetical protein